jgi:hypothetical protein
MKFGDIALGEERSLIHHHPSRPLAYRNARGAYKVGWLPFQSLTY